MTGSKYSEVGWGFSGLITLVFLVMIVLQGMNMQINLWTIVMGLMFLAGGSVLIGFVIVVIFVIYLSLLKTESENNKDYCGY